MFFPCKIKKKIYKLKNWNYFLAKSIQTISHYLHLLAIYAFYGKFFEKCKRVGFTVYIIVSFAPDIRFYLPIICGCESSHAFLIRSVLYSNTDVWITTWISRAQNLSYKRHLKIYFYDCCKFSCKLQCLFDPRVFLFYGKVCRHVVFCFLRYTSNLVLIYI